MTQLIKRACEDHPWDFIIPLDGDEFLRVPDRATLEAALADLDPASIGLSEVVNYIPTASDDPDELDVLRRIVHRAKTRPDTGSRIFKVVIPGAVIRQPGFSLNEGHHGVCIDGRPVAERRVEGAQPFAPFPVRSIDQFGPAHHPVPPRLVFALGLQSELGLALAARFQPSSRASLRSRPPT